MRDLADIELKTIAGPPLRGPGSGREAWVAHARAVADANAGLVEIVRLQAAEIAYLRGETELLKRQVASRKPKGGRPALGAELVSRIEAELAQGGADRGIAARYHVSHMSVHRIRTRMRQRERLG